MAEWKKVKLGDIAFITSSKRIFAKEYRNEGIPFYRGKEIIEKHKGNSVSTELFISRERYEEIKNKFDVPRLGDILLSSVGTLGVPWLVDEEEFYFKDGNLTWIRCNDKTIPEFLYLWLNSAEAKNQIDAKCIGSTQRALTIDTLNKFEVTLPSLDVQVKICNTIIPIGKKIEINREINNNLLQQAQAIFDDFANGLSDEKCALYNVVDIRDGTHDSPKAMNEGYPLVTSKHLLPFGVDTSSANLISKADYDKINERSKVDTGDILISMIGTVGLISYVIDSPANFAIKNVGLFKTSNTPMLSLYILLYLKSQSTAKHIEQCLAGSTQKYISLGELRKMPVLIPSKSELEQYNEVVSPIISQIALLVEENKRLSAIRDALLPKLMSGELDVSSINL